MSALKDAIDLARETGGFARSYLADPGAQARADEAYKAMLVLLSDEEERIHRLEEAVAGLLILTNEWEPDHASPEDLAKIRRARWAIGGPRLTAQLEVMGSPPVADGKGE